MINLKIQQGVGLIEVLVALLLIAIGILGFAALQLRAMDASNEAAERTFAINIARDLAERIRVNRNGLLDYKTAATVTDCAVNLCTTKQMAEYDYKQVSDKAINLGMQLDVLDCKGSVALERKCIYVAWEGTTPTDGTADTDCTNGPAYLPESKCIIVEVYNYDK